jgi:hypothetical protein
MDGPQIDVKVMYLCLSTDAKGANSMHALPYLVQCQVSVALLALQAQQERQACNQQQHSPRMLNNNCNAEACNTA